jgi:hypothetical protein
MLDGAEILFLTTVLPGKMRMGSEVASQSIIDELIKLGCKVTVVGYIRRDDNYDLGTNEICAGRRYIETKTTKLYPLFWLASAILRGLPYSVAKYRSNSFARLVESLLRKKHYDIAIIDHVQMSWLANSVAVTDGTIGLAHNVEHQMYNSFISEQNSALRRWVFRRESRLLQQMEIDFANKVDQMWALTRLDADFFTGVKKSGDVKEIPLPAGAAPSKGALVHKEFDIGLIGSWTWKANEEGLRWFFDSVYPHLSTNVTICIAGSGAKWLKGYYANVKYLGFVDDVREFLQQARVVAIPTLSGGGIQIKTLDAIASGSHIVATPLALRGIADHPSTVVVAETPEKFAAQLRAAVKSSDMDSSAALAIDWSQRRQSLFSSKVVQGLQSLTH